MPLKTPGDLNPPPSSAEFNKLPLHHWCGDREGLYFRLHTVNRSTGKPWHPIHFSRRGATRFDPPTGPGTLYVGETIGGVLMEIFDDSWGAVGSASRKQVLQRVFGQMQFGLNAFEVFRDRLPEPWERRPSLREKQMARPASVIIRRTKSANRHTKMRSLFQQFRPVTLQLPIGPCVPDLNGFSHSQQIITVPVRGGRGLQVVTNARAESSCAKSAAHVGVIARHDVVSVQAPDLQAVPRGLNIMPAAAIRPAAAGLSRASNRITPTRSTLPNTAPSSPLWESVMTALRAWNSSTSVPTASGASGIRPIRRPSPCASRSWTCTCRPSRRLPSGGGGGRFNTPCQRSLKVMDPNPATQPCRLDPVEVSEWIYAHPSFRMRDVHECHPKKDPRQEHLAF